MIHRVTCDRCGSISEYDDKSIWEGNREHRVPCGWKYDRQCIYRPYSGSQTYQERREKLIRISE